VSQVDTDHFRQKLLEERQRVVEAISYLHEENPGSIEDETDEVVGSVDNHLADTATVTVDREIDYTLEENSEHVLREIDAALKRIEDGTFGACQTCRKPIESERLDLLPYATQCIDCKRRAGRA
jgi:RNA polymerase-binding protein DksA